MDATIPPDRYCQVGSIRTRFWAAGEGGTPVVLIHGLGSFVEDWSANVTALSERQRLYALDLPGCGRSDKPAAGYSLPGLVRFVYDFLAAQGIARASLVGHSLGGAVALQFALCFPEQVERLVLLSSAGLGREVALHLRLCALPAIGEWLTRPTRQGIARYFQKAMYDPAAASAAFIETCYQLASLPGAQRALLATLRAVIGPGGLRAGVFRPILAGLPRLRFPTLVVWGRQDPIVPVAHAAVAAGWIAGARLHILDHCGHFPQIERPEEFNALVAGFLGPGLP